MRWTRTSAIAAVVAAWLLLLAACSTSTSDTTSDETNGGTTAATSPVDAADPSNPTDGEGERGWLDGNPADADAASRSSAAHDEAMTESITASDAMDLGDDADSIGPAPGPDDRSGDTGPPRAGSIDDNERLDDYLAYLDRIAELELPVRPVDVSEQHRIQVVGANDQPVAGAAVELIADGETVGVVRTGADGVALIHPLAYPGVDDDSVVEFAVGDDDPITIDRSSTDPIVLPVGFDGGPAETIALDVLFLIDATGSMGDEIERLKATIDQVADRTADLDAEIDLRLAMTVYRDEGDAYVTRTFDFTDDIDSFRDALADVVADGGGDYPEALDEALADALAKPAWRSPESTIQLVFLLADAPPQVERQVTTPYDASLLEAAARGIRIFPIASSGSDDQAEYVFRQLAQFTGARFVFLSYGVEGAATGEATDIETVDYEELPLEDLVVRLIAEEVEDLGVEVSVAPSETTTTTTEQ